MPHVDTPEEAKEVVDRLKYLPLGHRSMGGYGPHYGLRTGVGEAAEAMNAANMTVVMLETPTAIKNADAIAAVPGVEVLLIGTNDLCAELGIQGQFASEPVVAAYKAVVTACKKHGKYAGMGGVYTEDLLSRYIGMGMRFILAGQDSQFVMSAGGQRAAAMRKLSPGGR
jgi:4-hydroxy-2-oxoheptanedioate aldolase